MINSSNKSFCPAPWISTYVDPSGEIDNCCVGKNKLGNINQDHDITKTMISGRNIDIQKSMLQGNVINGCKSCHNHPGSLQDRFFEMFPNYDNNLYQVGNFKLQYLDLRWSNVCNYACVYCSPLFSSTWASELNKTYNLERVVKNSMIDYVVENIRTVKQLYLAGGEPLLMKENETVLMELLEHNPDCQVSVNTNLSQIKNNKIFDLLIQIKNVQWIISAEASGQQYEYIRYPGLWETFNNNLAYLKTYADNVVFNMVVISLNALSIWDTIDQLTSAETPMTSMALSMYNGGAYPGPWDVRHMPLEFQQQVFDRMNRPAYKQITGYTYVFEYLSAMIYIPSNGPWQQLAELDHRRNQNSKHVFPEIYQYSQKETTQ